MQIEVISVSVNTVPTAKGSYQVAEVAYKDIKEGKVSGKKIMSFANKKVFEIVSRAKQGQQYEVSLDKDNQGYWQWSNIVGTEYAAGNTKPATGSPTPRSTYETPEERAKRQDFIIRQSSLSAAVNLLKTEKNTPKPEEVMELAEMFVKFVYNPVVDSTGFDTMEDDIPM